MNETKQFCRRCRKDLTTDEIKSYEEKKFLPLCKGCEPIIESNFQKWKEKFQQFKF